MSSCVAQKRNIFAIVQEGVRELELINSFEPDLDDNEKIGFFSFDLLSFPVNHEYIPGSPYYLVEKDNLYRIYVEKRGANFRQGGNYWIKGVEGKDYSYFIAGSCRDDECRGKNLNATGIFVVDMINSGLYFVGMDSYIPGLLKPEQANIVDVFRLNSDLLPINRFRVYNGTIVSKGNIVYEMFHVRSSEELLKQEYIKDYTLDKLTFKDIAEIVNKDIPSHLEIEGLAEILPGLPIWFCYPECFITH